MTIFDLELWFKINKSNYRMKMFIKKFITGVFCLAFLSGCAQNVAFLGPAITVSNSGNIHQASFQYVSGAVFKNETGKDTLTYLKDIAEDNNKKKFKKKFNNLVENKIKITRKKLFINQN